MKVWEKLAAKTRYITKWNQNQHLAYTLDKLSSCNSHDHHGLYFCATLRSNCTVLSSWRWTQPCPLHRFKHLKLQLISSVETVSMIFLKKWTKKNISLPSITTIWSHDVVELTPKPGNTCRPRWYHLGFGEKKIDWFFVDPMRNLPKKDGAWRACLIFIDVKFVFFNSQLKWFGKKSQTILIIG